MIAGYTLYKPMDSAMRFAKQGEPSPSVELVEVSITDDLKLRDGRTGYVTKDEALLVVAALIQSVERLGLEWKPCIGELNKGAFVSRFTPSCEGYLQGFGRVRIRAPQWDFSKKHGWVTTGYTCKCLDSRHLIVGFGSSGYQAYQKWLESDVYVSRREAARMKMG